MLTVASALGLLISAIACWVAIDVLRRFQILDIPNARSSHGRSTVRGAGVGLACGSVLGLVAAAAISDGMSWPWRSASVVVIASLTAAAIGLADDLRDGISFRVRLAGQVVVAASAVVAIGFGDSAMPWGALLACAAVVGIVGYVNAFNFMDGINGISGASAFVAGAMFVVVGRLDDQPLLEAGGAALAAACLGFLPFNFPTARAFLGDVGSYFIGAWIALLAFVALLAGVPLDVVVAPLALYLADVGFTLGSRVWRGEQWHAAHREHAYQRLAAGGLGHTGTTLVVLAVTLGLSGLGLVSLRFPTLRAVAWAASAGLLGAYLVAPSLLVRRRRTASAATLRTASTPRTEHFPQDPHEQ